MNEIVPSNTSLTPEQAFPFQKQIDSWNMESAVEKLRPKVERLRKASVDVARDLFIAHEALAQRGGDPLRPGGRQGADAGRASNP